MKKVAVAIMMVLAFGLMANKCTYNAPPASTPKSDDATKTDKPAQPDQPAEKPAGQ